MKRTVVAIAALASVLAGAVAAQQPTPQQFGIPGRGNLVLNVPPGWRVIDLGYADPPSVVVRMRPESGDAFQLQLTSLLIPPEKLGALTEESMRARVQENAQRVLPRAVEREVTVSELRGKDSVGYYYALTDRQSANSGSQYRYLVQGSVRSGELITVFTLFTRDPALPEKEAALRMLGDASFARGAAAANRPPPEALQVAKLDSSYELQVPAMRLVMSIPKGKLVQSPYGGGNNHPRYFYFLDGALNVSGWFEPADKFHGMQEFWEANTREWKQRGLPEPKNVAFAKIGDWETVLYDHDLPGGSSASNSHLRAHLVRNGTWIDLHISLTAQAPAAESRQRVQAFLESIQVKEKP